MTPVQHIRSAHLTLFVNSGVCLSKKRSSHKDGTLKWQDQHWSGWRAPWRRENEFPHIHRLWSKRTMMLRKKTSKVLMMSWSHWGQGGTYPAGPWWVHCEFWNNSCPWWVLFRSTHLFTLILSTRSLVGTFKKYLSISSNFIHQAHGGYFWKVPTHLLQLTHQTHGEYFWKVPSTVPGGNNQSEMPAICHNSLCIVFAWYLNLSFWVLSKRTHIWDCNVLNHILNGFIESL